MKSIQYFPLLYLIILAHLLTKSHAKHENIKNQFLQYWTNPDSGTPRVERIFWIRTNKHLYDVFKATSDQIGNVKRRFHGTSQSPTCTFGHDPSKTPCQDPTCNVCSICRQSFRLNKAGKGGGVRMNLRFGQGIYFSDISSKSNDYNHGSLKEYNGRKWKCMFLCNVAIGNAFVTRDGTLPGHLCPPRGHHSVVGEPGGELSYGEVVVYDETQASPAYLIVYSLD